MLSEVYLISSLPALNFGETPPISLAEFTTMAYAELSRKNSKQLEEVDLQNIDATGNNSLSIEIGSLMEDLQQELASIRQSKNQGEKAKTDLLPASILKVNPLDREIQIMQWLWEKLDNIEQGRTFTMYEVVVYKLKLQLLLRLQSFDSDKGGAVLSAILDETENM